MFNAHKVWIIGAALVLGSALSASAADLGGLKDEPIAAPAASGPSGWYLRADGGYAWYNKPGMSIEDPFVTDRTKMDGAWSVGGGIGRYFGRGFRGDITVDHLFDATTETTFCDCGTSGHTKFDFSSTVVLANLYYDINRGGRFSPYIGGGVGFAHNETSSGTIDPDCGCSGTIDGGSSNSFAAAGMAGVTWRIRGGETRYMGGGMKDEPVAVSSGNALYLDFGYRFLYLGDVKTGAADWNGNHADDVKVKDVTAHQIRIGLRYDLN